MTNGLNEKQFKIVNILAWIIITVMIGYGAWLGNKFYDLKESIPKEYVQKDQHNRDLETLGDRITRMESRISCNIEKVEQKLVRMDGKLDKLISHEGQSETNR